ncbi:MAG: diacylglycerol kinase [Methylibium sp.]|uniref:diacylglycerol/lipid kinase family protein n=1 Tax=Methylibium sp. TaxID=2067992 RepID=UPI0017F33EA7|nr:diacylglycerol kinase family protein [Methylibium sp.]MBA3598833.1 diacylglycerol kinase [Methylibium sp.]
MSLPVVDADAPFFIVLNAGSGKRDASETRAAIETVLGEAGRTCEVFEVKDASRLQETARSALGKARERGGVVVAAGGDGSLNAVAQLVLGRGCAFGVVPLGTFNYFARTHGIPTDTADAARSLLDAVVRPVQVGLVNDRLFLVNASLGLYPQLLEDREGYKQQFGRSRGVAFIAGLVSVLREHRQLRIRLERPGGTRSIRTPTLFVGNNRLQLEQIGIDEAALIEHGQLAAITLRPVGWLSMLGLLVSGALGRLGDADNVFSFGVDRMTVRQALPYGPKRVKVATDGEIVWLRMPLELRVSPEPLYLLAPRSPVFEGARADEAAAPDS